MPAMKGFVFDDCFSPDNAAGVQFAPTIGLDPGFLRQFMAENPLSRPSDHPEAVIKIHKISTEVGAPSVRLMFTPPERLGTRLVDIWYLLTQQPCGMSASATTLLSNGYNNVFFVRCGHALERVNIYYQKNEGWCV
ncbi:MAG: hypothetical protein WC480_04885, partial [Patescibacteria group bacterium]